MQEKQQMQVWSLGREDPLKEEMEIYSSILVWKILRAEDSGGLQSIELHRVRHDWAQHNNKHNYIHLSLCRSIHQCNKMLLCYYYSLSTCSYMILWG